MDHKSITLHCSTKPARTGSLLPDEGVEKKLKSRLIIREKRKMQLVLLQGSNGNIRTCENRLQNLPQVDISRNDPSKPSSFGQQATSA
jgi:hypothetical protein